MAMATTLLRAVPGAILQRASRAMDGSEQYIIAFPGTGTLPCVATVCVDGVQVEQPVDAWLDPYLLAGVEVYTRAATSPTEYRRANCGVVMFWTREGDGSGASSRHTLRYLAAGAAALAIAAVFFLVH